MVFMELWNRSALAYMSRPAQNGAEPLSHSGKHTWGGSWVVFNTKAQRPPCGFLVERACPIRSTAEWRRLFGDIHEASRSVSHNQPRVDGQHLAQYVSPFTAQHENHAAILLCQEESKARSSVPAMSLSRLHPSHTKLSTNNQTSSFFHLGRRGLCLLGCNSCCF